MINKIRTVIAAQFFKIGKWIQPNAGPIGEDPKRSAVPGYVKAGPIGEDPK